MTADLGHSHVTFVPSAPKVTAVLADDDLDDILINGESIKRRVVADPSYDPELRVLSLQLVVDEVRTVAGPTAKFHDSPGDPR